MASHSRGLGLGLGAIFIWILVALYSGGPCRRRLAGGRRGESEFIKVKIGKGKSEWRQKSDPSKAVNPFDVLEKAKKKRLRYLAGIRSDDDVPIADDLVGAGRTREEMIRDGVFTRGDKRIMEEKGRYKSKYYKFQRDAVFNYQEAPRDLKAPWQIYKKYKHSTQPAPAPTPPPFFNPSEHLSLPSDEIIADDDIEYVARQGKEKRKMREQALRESRRRDGLEGSRIPHKERKERLPSSGGIFSSGEEEGDDIGQDLKQGYPPHKNTKPEGSRKRRKMREFLENAKDYFAADGSRADSEGQDASNKEHFGRDPTDSEFDGSGVEGEDNRKSRKKRDPKRSVKDIYAEVMAKSKYFRDQKKKQSKQIQEQGKEVIREFEEIIRLFCPWKTPPTNRHFSP
ncbi:hypothetical protein AAMO2058_000782700 [Amorphochlora amoebiformis]